MNNTYFEISKQKTKIVKRVSLITLLVNLFLAALKTCFGLIFFNVSVLSDALNSVLDVGTTMLVLITAFVSVPQGDKKHNYGHEKIEPLAILLFSLVLGAVGVSLIFQGISGIISPKKSELNLYLVSVAAVSVATKEILYWYTIFYAKKTRSQALRAGAWDHRSDALSSLAVLLGLVCSNFIKTDLVESIAVLLVAALIIKITAQIFISSVNQLIDKAADEAVCAEIESLIKEFDMVLSVDSLKTRLFGNAIYVDVEIGIDGSLSVMDSHKIAQAVHDKLEAWQKYHIKHCHVHVNPAQYPLPIECDEI